MLLPYPIHSIEEWIEYLGVITHEKFVQNYPHAFLVTVNALWVEDEAPYEFVTLVGDQYSRAIISTSEPIHGVYQVKKQKRLYSPMISIGRTENNDIVLDSTKISKLHAYFLYKEEEKKYLFVDAKSTNKSWVNQVECQPSKKTELCDGDKINLGKVVDFHFFLPPSFYSYIQSKPNSK